MHVMVAGTDFTRENGGLTFQAVTGGPRPLAHS